MAFCKGMGRKIKTIVNKVDDVVNKYSNAALEITAKLKPFLSGPLGQLITDIIPGTWDDELRNKASVALNAIVGNLSIASEISKEPDLTKKLQLFMDELKKQHPEYQQAMLFKTASLLTKYMHGAQLSQSEYDIITQAKYIDKKDKK